jgi:DNA-binding LacI/PurR family transcriptional regulator
MSHSDSERGQAGLSYKYQRVRERLRQAVESGELTGKLPGERELSRRYGANPKTINKALTDLAIEGLLVRHVGRGTFVSSSGTSEEQGRVHSRPLKFGYLTPVDNARGCAQELCKRTAALLEPMGHGMEPLSLPVEPSGELSGRCLSADRLRAFDGLALYGARPSAELLASISREHLPLVMVNNQHPLVRTAAVLLDYAQGAFELCQHLIYLGHREIRLCVDPMLMPAAAQADTGYRAAMQRNGLSPRPMYGTAGPFDGGPALAAERGNPPTAIICIGCEIVPALSEAAAALNIKDLSLCCIPEPCDSATERLQLTSYEADAGLIARWIADLLTSASPTRWQRVVIVPGRIADRGSVAPGDVPAERKHSPDVAVL